MRCGPGSATARSRAATASSAVCTATAGTPMPSASWTKSRSGRERSSRSLGLRAAAAGAGAGQLDVQDGVRPVVHDHRRHVERLPGLRPQRLDRVHRRAVGLQREHRSVRAGDGGAGGQRQALADRPAGQLQPVVRRAAGGRRGHAHAGGGALVGDDRALGHDGGDRGGEASTGERAGRSLRPRGGRRCRRAVGDELGDARASAPAASSRPVASTWTSQPSGTRSLGLPG